MSDYTPFNNDNEEEARELFDLLDRLEKRDEVSRYRRNLRAFTANEPVELIDMDEEERRPDRFNPVEMSDEEWQDLLISDDYDTVPYVENTSANRRGFARSGAPVERRNPFAVLWGAFAANFPTKADSVGTKARKYGFFTSLLVMLLALIYLAVDLLIIPGLNARKKDELQSLYHPEMAQTVVSADEGDYPAKMLASFKDLYDRNDDVRGWISFHADGKKDFLDIEYPIVYSGDNEEYLRKDFDGNKNRNGTLFFDENNQLESYKDKNRSLIVYGHNMASGQMFAGLNKFLGSVNNARAAATLTMSTLYRQDQYLVFAVILTDESDKVKGRYFNTRRTTFEGDADFLDYVQQMRDRSLFDYPVEVRGTDQILVLSTCTGKTSAKVKDGRLVVVARRVRDGERVKLDTNAIVKNDDVIMPYYWYINQNKQVHQYYVDAGVDYPATPNLPTSSTTTTTGTGSDADSTTTGTQGGDTTDTTASTTTGSGTTTTTTTTKGDGPTQTTAPTTSATGGDTTTSATTGGDTTTSTETEGTEPTTPTEPTEGEHTHTYDDCEDTTCNGCDTTREPLAHNFVEGETIPATCIENGMIKRHCSECGKASNLPLPATGEHTYGEDGVCTGCGNEKPADPTEPTE